MCFPLNITKFLRNFFFYRNVSGSLSFEILILFGLLLFLVNYSIPRYCHIYNYCYLLHFIDNNNIWFLSKIIISMTLYIHVPNKFVVDIFGNHMRMRRYYFSDSSRVNFLHNFQWTIPETMPCLVLYSVWATFEHLLMIWLIVSPVSQHILQEVESTLTNVVFDIVCSSYCLFLCRAYQDLWWYF